SSIRHTVRDSPARDRRPTPNPKPRPRRVAAGKPPPSCPSKVGPVKPHAQDRTGARGWQPDRAATALALPIAEADAGPPARVFDYSKNRGWAELERRFSTKKRRPRLPRLRMPFHRKITGAPLGFGPARVLSPRPG